MKATSTKSLFPKIREKLGLDFISQNSMLREDIKTLKGEIAKNKGYLEVQQRRINLLESIQNGENITNFTKDLNLSTKSKKNIITHLKPSKHLSFTMDSVKEFDRSLRIDDTHLRTLYLANLPNILTTTPIHKLLHLPLPLSLSYHIKGTSRSSMTQSAKRRLSVLEAEQNERIKKGKARDIEIDREIDEVNRLIEDLTYEREQTFLVSLYAQIRSDNEKDLITSTKTFQREMKDTDFVFQTYTFGQSNAFVSTLPIAQDIISKDHVLHTQAVANLLPFLTKTFNDESGILLGSSRMNNSLVLVDVFKARNANINIFGTSGSGKSVTAKLLISRLLLRGVQNIIIDPEGEYLELTQAFGGQVISFDQDHGMNIFQVPKGADVSKHVSTLKTFFKFYVQNDRFDSALIDKLLMDFYQSNNAKNLQNFVEHCSQKTAPFVEDLKMLLTGSLKGIFDGKGEIELDNDIVCFDLSLLATDERKIPAMFMVSSFIYSLIENKERRRMIYIDESHKLLANKETIAFYIDLVKTARKRRAGVVSITQNPEDFREENGAKTILTQAESSFILKQAYSSTQYIQDKKIFPLTEQEVNTISTLNVGEALFIREREHIMLDIFSLPSEEDFIYT